MGDDVWLDLEFYRIEGGRYSDNSDTTRRIALDGLLHAGEPLKKLLTSQDWQGRLEGVRVLEALQVPSFYHPLIDLLNDESIEVQTATIKAAARIGAPELVPYLLPKLDNPLTIWYATDAIASAVGEDMEMLDQMLLDPRQSTAGRLQLVHVLSQQRSPRAVEILLSHLTSDNDLLRGAIYQSLLQLRAAGFSSDEVEKNSRQVLAKEFSLAYKLHVLRHDLASANDDFLLDETLQIKIERARDRILALMDLLYDEISLEQMRAYLDHRNGRLRATVIELADNVVERETKEYLMPLLSHRIEERLTVAQQLLQMPHLSPVERLKELAASSDAWLRSCALHSASRRKLVELTPSLENALMAAEDLVAQTARAAYGKLHGIEALKNALDKPA
jgi:hypothetical protein